jgi:3-phytase
MTYPTAFRLSCCLLLITFVVLEWHTVVRGDLPTVAAVLETRPSLGDDEGGNADADDPAIWVHPKDATKSLVVSTLKEGGLDVYDLTGGWCSTWRPAPPGPGSCSTARATTIST